MSTGKHVVYRFYDADDMLLYVGVTSRWPTRRQQHRRDKPWFLDVVREEIEAFDTNEEACAREHRLIIDLAPRYNRKRYNQGPRHHLLADRVPLDFEPTAETVRMIKRLSEKTGMRPWEIAHFALYKLAQE